MKTNLRYKRRIVSKDLKEEGQPDILKKLCKVGCKRRNVTIDIKKEVKHKRQLDKCNLRYEKK